jgi:hypothetical protein
MSDSLGLRGESIFAVLMTRFFGLPEPLFRVTFLGDKAPTLDFFVELIDAGPITPFCLVQVKATSQGFNSRGRLKVSVSRRDMKRLRAYPGPTYVVGIDERQELGYIVSARSGETTGLSSLPTTYPLNQENLMMLYEEVSVYWGTLDASFSVSRFT